MSRPRHLWAPVTVVGAALALLLLLPAPVDAAPSLRVSQRDGLNPDGQAVTISGSGFDPAKGIYVAYCVTPQPGQLPSPCGGGVDTAGTGGASVWISDNPPTYGEGLVQPFGPGGSFMVTLRVTPTIGDIDCRVSSCAVVTRADHLRTSDRSQDVVVPVSFAAPPEPEPPAQPSAPDQPEEPAEPSAPDQPRETTASDGDAQADRAAAPVTPAEDSTDSDPDAVPSQTPPPLPEIDLNDPSELPEPTGPEQPPHDQTDDGRDEAPHDDAIAEEEAGTSTAVDDTAAPAVASGPAAGASLPPVAAVLVVLAVLGAAVGWWLRRRRVAGIAAAAGRTAPDDVDGATP